MTPEIPVVNDLFETQCLPCDSAGITVASQLIKQSQLVALPTETVYGLAASIFCEDAIRAIFRVKGRPANNPLIVHIPSPLASLNALHKEGLIDRSRLTLAQISTAQKLMEAFWPGPLTIVLPKGPKISSIITAGGDYVALRQSSHPGFSQFINQINLPIAAPSANLSNGISPTTAQAVLEELFGKIPLILDGGACQVGLESTVVRLRGCLNTSISRREEKENRSLSGINEDFPTTSHTKIGELRQDLLSQENPTDQDPWGVDSHIEILRPGIIGSEDLASKGFTCIHRALGPKMDPVKTQPRSKPPANNDFSSNQKEIYLSPGQLSKHYAPKSPLVLVASNHSTMDKLLPALVNYWNSKIKDFDHDSLKVSPHESLSTKTKQIRIILFHREQLSLWQEWINQAQQISQTNQALEISLDFYTIHCTLSTPSSPGNAEVIARELFSLLRDADRTKPDLIIVEKPQTLKGPWRAISDRLTRAESFHLFGNNPSVC